ncbi:bifunctional 4-hydroxy-2-oxoglutarate aldolase/2-dehydro-3-deoxy-phosphogluconate aldolase [Sphingobium subterraneum]|uniref:2-dehydro-3-deoxy-phosphogluconate aldolase n=1 Tax=Sphingobium subterraneum TaxID=627688 RepID=A0A841IYQ4_9SPHN|nr:bifunctional 4-hydroxy-2-oxoglutarate aldolase/2-dehydro-3-deoxy-phosphogluconate aldolase [Sphingobium subterraneum]MBB6122406.1 2-dehydro-3-deoxyphosphogluconate aldolase/(4S)-4-hydroxy-2-oxoglutarate aldolase [Sphingobium subterraneum]
MTLTVDDILALAPVIPVLVIERVEDAVPIAQALVKGGLFALEVTLRTPAALDVIRAMSTVEGAVVGAGTVLNPAQLDEALEAGARFIVSPGLTEPLGQAAIASGVPFLPGTATAADIMRGMDMGLSRFKFFPAETSGGLPALKALAAPFHQARFCPTGGITAQSAPQWLAEPAVHCVGGSWVVPKGPIEVATIERLAREAAVLA